MVHHSLYGFPFWIHWMAHFIAAIIFFSILDIVIIIFLKISASESYHIVLLIFFLLIFNVTAILFSFMIVSICQRVDLAISIVLVLWVLMFSIFAIIMEKSNIVRIGLIMLSVLFFNNALAFGLRSLQQLTDDLFDDLNYDFFWITTMLIFDILLYFMILCAVELLYCTPYTDATFLRRKIQVTVDPESWPIDKTKTSNVKSIDLESNKSVEAVRCKKISKYEHGKPRIRNITTVMFENEVTVLLGHTDAGMTTLLCIIAGYKKPTAGTLTFYGVDVSDKNCISIRKCVSFCPPNNSLFDYLTVEEHLLYTMNIKNISQEKIDYEIIKWLRVSKLYVHAKTQARKLTFENKRFLCLIIALCGHSKIVLMDKPTVEMTVKGRKRFWDIVRSEKRGRCVIISTNSVCEAESVGDRVAIFENGDLLAIGTQFFLKIKYANSYYLLILKDNGCQTHKVTEVISQFAPDVVILHETWDRIHYRISTDYINIFPKLLFTLEQKSIDLRLDSVNVLGTQLSDVYMNFGKHPGPEKLFRRGQFLMKDIRLKKGIKLKCSQVSAMLYKKLLYQIPSIVPAFMIFVSVVFILIVGSMSTFFSFEHLADAEIDLGFQSQRESGGLFKEILTAEYKRRYPLAEIEVKEQFDEEYGVFTWKSRNVKSTTEDNILTEKSNNDRVAIGLPNKDSNEGNIWFNEKIAHSSAVSLNLFHNALLRMATQTDSYRTKVSNKPLAITISSKFSVLNTEYSHMKIPLSIGTILPFLISSFIYFVVLEKKTDVRSLQFLAGVKIPIYWLVPLLWDFCIFSFVILTTTIIIFLVSGVSYGTGEKFGILLNLNVFGFAALCETYLLSFCFTSPRMAYFTCALMHLTLGLFAHVVYWYLIDANNIFWTIAMFSPDFAMLDGMSMIYIEKSQKDICKNEMKLNGGAMRALCDEYYECCCDTIFKWSYPGLMPALTYQLLMGFIFLAAILTLEFYIYYRKFDRNETEFLHSACGPTEEPEVLAEKQRVNELSSTEISEYTMVVDQLEDSIPTIGSQVRTISFTVQSKECVVILAERNSGTSELMHQLIGERGFSFGDVYVKGINIKEDLASVRSLLGFCPRDNGLLHEITGRQLMKIICLIRGVPSNRVNLVINEMVMLLEMQGFISKKVGALSIQKKRRINIAIAFIVDVEVLLIDEPTHGISPVTRNIIWNVLRYARFTGKSIVFTTTNPWECEAMADRVIIFSEGNMLFYGSLQRMRNKYSNGVIFEVKIKKDGKTYDEVKRNFEDDMGNILRFVTFMAVDSELRSILDGAMKFYIPIKNIIWWRLFDLIEKNRNRLNIENYVLCQSTFEDMMQNLMLAHEE